MSQSKTEDRKLFDQQVKQIIEKEALIFKIKLVINDSYHSSRQVSLTPTVKQLSSNVKHDTFISLRDNDS